MKGKYAKTLLAVLGLVFFFTASAFGEDLIPGNYPSWVLKILIGQSVGTGFLLQSSNWVYIVTARHVLFGTPESTNLLADNASFISYRPDQPEGHQTREMDIDLGSLLKMGEIRYPTNHDVALVRIELCDPINPLWVKYNTNIIRLRTLENDFTPIATYNCARMKEVPVGADTIAAGFSSSANANVYNQLSRELPLLRRGIVAGSFKERGTLVLDSKVYGGDSGGPVMMKTTVMNAFPTQVNFRIIGIQTQNVVGLEKWVQFGNTGYSILEPMDAILDLMWN